MNGGKWVAAAIVVLAVAIVVAAFVATRHHSRASSCGPGTASPYCVSRNPWQTP